MCCMISAVKQSLFKSQCHDTKFSFHNSCLFFVAYFTASDQFYVLFSPQHDVSLILHDTLAHFSIQVCKKTYSLGITAPTLMKRVAAVSEDSILMQRGSNRTEK